MTGNRVEEGERGGGYLRVLSSPSLPFCKLLNWRKRVVRLCDVLLESPTVGWETQVCERRAESGERKLESGKYRFYRVIFGEAVPISAELEID